MADYRVPVLEDFAWQPPVADRVTVHPGDPAKGTRYIVTSEATGDFTGHEDDIATAVVSAPSAPSDWIFDTPTEGWTTYVKDEDVRYIYNGAAWAADAGDSAGSQVLVLESEMSQTQSRVLVLESEMSSVQSDLLVEKSTVNAVSEATSQVTSAVLLLESEMSQTQSRVLVVESELSAVQADKQDKGAYVAEYGCITFTI